MTKHMVTTPEPGHTGALGRVMFHEGKVEMDSALHPEELRYVTLAGYTVEPPYDPDNAVEEMDVDGDGTPERLPRRNASVEVWRAFAIEHGVPEDEANAASRDDLIARLTKEDSK